MTKLGAAGEIAVRIAGEGRTWSVCRGGDKQHFFDKLSASNSLVARFGGTGRHELDARFFNGIGVGTANTRSATAYRHIESAMDCKGEKCSGIFLDIHLCFSRYLFGGVRAYGTSACDLRYGVDHGYAIWQRFHCLADDLFFCNGGERGDVGS